jgi:hypothetical protein
MSETNTTRFIRCLIDYADDKYTPLQIAVASLELLTGESEIKTNSGIVFETIPICEISTMKEEKIEEIFKLLHSCSWKIVHKYEFENEKISKYKEIYQKLHSAFNGKPEKAAALIFLLNVQIKGNTYRTINKAIEGIKNIKYKDNSVSPSVYKEIFVSDADLSILAGIESYFTSLGQTKALIKADTVVSKQGTTSRSILSQISNPPPKQSVFSRIFGKTEKGGKSKKYATKFKNIKKTRKAKLVRRTRRIRR